MIIGGASSGKNSHEPAGALGNFGNPLALRLDVSGDPGFLELQSRVGAVFLEAAAHDGLPFSEVVKEVRPGHEFGGNPLFNVAVSPLSTGAPAAEVSGGSFLEDLNFSFEDHGEKLCGAITYATDLFDRTTITEMVQHWQNLLTRRLRRSRQTRFGAGHSGRGRKKSHRLRVERHARRVSE